MYPVMFGVVDLIDYGPLWETMKEKGVSQYRLLQEGVDNKTLDSLKKIRTSPCSRWKRYAPSSAASRAMWYDS